jgi:hypothetical protein
VAALPETSSPDVTTVHFIQQGETTVFVGPGSGTLACACGNTLIQGFDPARFLAVGLQCGQCGQVTTTARLPDDTAPPFAVIVAEPVAEPRPVTSTMPDHAFVIGRAEMSRITALYQPVTPVNNVYRVSPALLDEAVATHDRHVADPLPCSVVVGFTGLSNNALGWAISHLRAHIRQENWSCLDDVPTSIATVHVAAFLHFVFTWSHHPLFPAMVATAASRGFSAHGLAPFATAHCATMQNNRVSFPAPAGTPPRLEGFNLATGPTDVVGVHVDAFDRFEVPFGRPWDQSTLRSAVADHIAAAQSRINLRRPGLLVLSPGSAMGGFDEALIEAVQHAMQTEGRKNRGLMAVAPIVLRLQAQPDPHAVRFGYGFFPTPNRHYAGDSLLQTGG